MPLRQKEVIYRPVGFDGFPPLKTASAADFIFASPHAQIDDSPAFIDAESALTIGRKELYDLCLALAKGVETLGHCQGNVAMIFSPNSLAWPVVFLGLLSAGTCATLANSSYTPPELAHQIRDSAPQLIFVHPKLFSLLISTLKSLDISENEMRKRVVVMSYVDADVQEENAQRIDASWTRLRQLLQKGKIDAPVRLNGNETDEATLLCYSSGTTGLNKGVETTHRNLVAVLQIYHPRSFPFDRTKDKEICFLPLYHIFGIVINLCYSFWAGVPVVILPKFEPLTFFKCIEQYGISIIKLAPPTLVVLASHPAFERHDLRCVQFMLCGAAPLGEGLTRRVLTRFRNVHKTRVTIVQGYGLTETSPTALIVPTKDAARKIGSAGALLPSLEARLVDEDGDDVEPGKGIPGELWIRGPVVMKGYLNNRAATTNAITKDGWFKTGDIAIRDNDGFYYIIDRKKELIKYKGFQVPPADLEAVLLTKQDIADAAVVGIESKDQATEFPRAYVVSTNNAALLAEPSKRAAFEKEVQEWVKPRVANHKYLRGGVRVVEAIPKSGAGKILRRVLRDRAEKEGGGLRATPKL